MRTTKFLSIAAIALVLGFASCSKEEQNVPSGEKFRVTLSFKNAATKAATRADGGTAVQGAEVSIEDGYLCFVNAGNAITDVYTISSAATAGKNINNGSLGATAVTLNDVPGSSSKVYMIINKGTTTFSNVPAPLVGNSILAYMNNTVAFQDQGNYTRVTSFGNAPLTNTSNPDVKEATVTLSTNVSRIQIKNISFSGNLSGTVEGIFVKGYYPIMELDGDATGTFVASTTPTDYADNTTIFPTNVKTFAYDILAKTFTSTELLGDKVSPNTANGTWGYNLFKSATPQIIIKLTGVTVNGSLLTDAQFVTINGFKKAGTGEVINNIEGGMIYTIADGAIDIKPENLGIVPGVTPMNVEVTVVPVTWQETQVIPNI
jgi:hypothetical protein